MSIDYPSRLFLLCVEKGTDVSRLTAQGYSYAQIGHLCSTAVQLQLVELREDGLFVLTKTGALALKDNPVTFSHSIEPRLEMHRDPMSAEGVFLPAIGDLDAFR